MLKPMIALVVVTLVASFFLGLVFTITEGPIAEQKAKAETEAIANLIAGTTQTENVMKGEPIDSEVSITKITKCLNNDGQVLGHVLSVAPKGYSGAIDIMVGITGGVVQGVEIISHSETPGLGANADTPAFTGQYTGKTGSFNVIKIGPAGENEIQAIASATITSQAVTDGVNAALTFYSEFQLGVEQ
jgi:electron transport complex protein RnfG